MAFGSSGQKDEITDINITPFVDVVLVLLVIFMVTAPLIAQQVLEINLPAAKSARETNSDILAVAVTRTGQILLNGQLVSASAFLQESIKQKELRPGLQAVLAADGESAHKHVVTAIDLLRRAGIENLAFQVESPEQISDLIDNIETDSRIADEE